MKLSGILGYVAAAALAVGLAGVPQGAQAATITPTHSAVAAASAVARQTHDVADDVVVTATGAQTSAIRAAAPVEANGLVTTRWECSEPIVGVRPFTQVCLKFKLAGDYVEEFWARTQYYQADFWGWTSIWATNNAFAPIKSPKINFDTRYWWLTYSRTTVVTVDRRLPNTRICYALFKITSKYGQPLKDVTLDKVCVTVTAAGLVPVPPAVGAQANTNHVAGAPAAASVLANNQTTVGVANTHTASLPALVRSAETAGTVAGTKAHLTSTELTSVHLTSAFVTTAFVKAAKAVKAGKAGKAGKASRYTFLSNLMCEPDWSPGWYGTHIQICMQFFWFSGFVQSLQVTIKWWSEDENTFYNVWSPAGRFRQWASPEFHFGFSLRTHSVKSGWFQINKFLGFGNVACLELFRVVYQSPFTYAEMNKLCVSGEYSIEHRGTPSISIISITSGGPPLRHVILPVGTRTTDLALVA